MRTARRPIPAQAPPRLGLLLPGPPPPLAGSDCISGRREGGARGGGRWRAARGRDRPASLPPQARTPPGRPARPGPAALTESRQPSGWMDACAAGSAVVLSPLPQQALRNSRSESFPPVLADNEHLAAGTARQLPRPSASHWRGTPRGPTGPPWLQPNSIATRPSVCLAASSRRPVPHYSSTSAALSALAPVRQVASSCRQGSEWQRPTYC